jgi:hypothetical protein
MGHYFIIKVYDVLYLPLFGVLSRGGIENHIIYGRCIPLEGLGTWSIV